MKQLLKLTGTHLEIGAAPAKSARKKKRARRKKSSVHSVVNDMVAQPRSLYDEAALPASHAHAKNAVREAEDYFYGGIGEETVPDAVTDEIAPYQGLFLMMYHLLKTAGQSVDEPDLRSAAKDANDLIQLLGEFIDELNQVDLPGAANVESNPGRRRQLLTPDESLDQEFSFGGRGPKTKEIHRAYYLYLKKYGNRAINSAWIQRMHDEVHAHLATLGLSATDDEIERSVLEGVDVGSNPGRRKKKHARRR
jgi:hypothetical protein